MTGTDQKGKEGSVFISARAPVWKKRAESSFIRKHFKKTE